MSINWLDRNLAAPGPYLCLCLSQKDYEKAFRYLGVDIFAPWINQNAQATTHLFSSKDGELAAVVCLGNYSSLTAVQTAALLVHEAVHVWQAYCDFYGEKQPGAEQEAYAIQSISQSLMTAFIEQSFSVAEKQHVNETTKTRHVS
jgi:hypothetical protein